MGVLATIRGNATALHRARLILLAGALMAFTGWWELLHELARNWILAVSWQEEFASPARFFMTFHCPSRALGMLIGAGGYLLLSRENRQEWVRRIPLVAWVAILVAIDLLHFVALCELYLYPLAALLHIAANAILVYGFIGAAQVLFERPAQLSALIAIAIASGLALVNLVVVPVLDKSSSPWFDESCSLAFLLIACLCSYGFARLLPTTADPRLQSLLIQARIVDSKEPRALIAHLVMYGAVLGFLHTIGRRVVYGETFSTAGVPTIAVDGSIPLGLGALLAIALVLVLHTRRECTFARVWSTLRKAVFTLAVLEFLMVPLVSIAIPAVVTGDCAAVLYQMLFIMGCCLIYKESDCTGTGLAAWGILFLSLGQFVSGIICEYTIRQVLMDSELFAVLRIVAFLLCTLATFWVGSDADIKKLWGLRRDYLPKQYQDKLVREKVAALAQQASLTKREQEVLVLLAQGVRADAIGNQLFISPNTVRTHIQNAYGKLDIHSVKELNALLADAA